MADGADRPVYRASATAPVNIAVIKYWGKRDAALNLPTNSSLSVTLAQRDLKAHTTATCSAQFSSTDGDTLILNGAPAPLQAPRTVACIAALRAARTSLEDTDPSLPRLASLPLRLASANNFPTAAGLASSAAGFAALVRSVANLYDLPASPEELSRIARQGSGSACRSLLGGYVAWEMGAAADGSDSRAEQVAPASHWPDMRAVILVVSARQKDVGSSVGMQRTAATSALFAHRVKEVVPQRMREMRDAVAARDFDAFACLTMRDSNGFHATCLDSEPPIFYLTDVSRAAVRAVDAINAATGGNRLVAAYTFDAGPNAVVFYQAGDEAVVAGFFKTLLGDKEGWDSERGRQIQLGDREVELDEQTRDTLQRGVSRVILTGVGEGPMSTDEHLIDTVGELVG